MNLQPFFIITILITLEYMLVFFAVIADLVSGIKKSKKLGILRTYSYGFRSTVDKLGKYYLPLFALTVVDFMQILSLWYLNTFHSFSLPLFPIMTLVGSIGIGLIEVKSILEKAEDKVKFERIGKLAIDVSKNKDSVASIVEEVVKYLNEKDIKNENNN